MTWYWQRASLKKLHRFFPQAQIDFLVRKGNEGLLQNHPYLHEVLIRDKKSGKLKNLWKLLLLIRKRRYDKVINVQRFAATGILTAFSGAKETIGFDKNPLSRLFDKKIKHVISDVNQSHADASGQHPDKRSFAGFTKSTAIMN